LTVSSINGMDDRVNLPLARSGLFDEAKTESNWLSAANSEEGRS